MDGSCHLKGVAAGETVFCDAEFVECDKLDKAMEACVSVTGDGKKAPVRKGVDAAFPELENAAQRKAAHTLAMALARNDQDGVLALWSAKGVNILGKRYRAEQGARGMARRSARHFHQIPCVANDSPGEDDDIDKWAVKDKNGQNNGMDCQWRAYLSKQGKIEIFSGGTEHNRNDVVNLLTEQQVLVMEKDAQGQWKLERVRWGTRSEYVPVSEKDRAEFEAYQ